MTEMKPRDLDSKEERPDRKHPKEGSIDTCNVGAGEQKSSAERETLFGHPKDR